MQWYALKLSVSKNAIKRANNCDAANPSSNAWAYAPSETDERRQITNKEAHDACNPSMFKTTFPSLPSSHRNPLEYEFL